MVCLKASFFQPKWKLVKGGGGAGARGRVSPLRRLHANLYLWSGLPGGAAGFTDVPSKELPATLLLRMPAFTRAHSLLHPWPL